MARFGVLGHGRGFTARIRLKVGHKVLIPFLALSLLTGIIASGIVALQVAAARRAQVDTTAVRLEDSVSSDFATFEQRQLTVVRTLKGTLGVPEAAVAGDRARLEQLLFPIVANQLPDPITAVVVAEDGTVLIKVQGNPAQPAVCTCSSGGQVGGWPDVALALANRSDRYGSKFVGIQPDPAGEILYAVAPMVLNGKPIGAMIVYEPLSALMKEAYAGSALVAAVFSTSGSRLASTPTYPTAAIALTADQRRAAETGTDVVHISLNSRTGAVEAFFVPWQLRHAIFGYASVVVPASALIGAASDISRLMIGIFVAVSLVTFVAAFFVARLITRPLDLLINATHQVAAGNLAYRAPLVTHDEVGTLTASFNEMTESLQERTEVIHRNTEATVLTLADAIDARDPYTHGHSVRVAAYSVALAESAGLTPDLIADVRQGCLVHDIGKIGVVDSILRKAGALNDEESDAMKQHPMIGYQMLRHLHWGERVMDIVRYHHERWDGFGYPEGLAGTDIPQVARLVAVADTFDAMTSDRPYRKGLTVERAAEVIREGAGSQFDPAMAANFAAALTRIRSIHRASRPAEQPAPLAMVPAPLAT